MRERASLSRLDEWLDQPADGLGYGVAVALVVFAVLAALLIVR